MMKEKKIVYLSQEESKELTKKYSQRVEILELKKASLLEEYVRLGKLQKVKKSKIICLGAKIDRLNTAIQKYKVALIKLENGIYEKLNWFKKFNKMMSSLPYKKQKVVYGIIFLLPWFIGFCIFFAVPMISTFYWSMNDMRIADGGGFTYKFIWFKNFVDLFQTKTLAGKTIKELLASSMLNIVIDLPTIIILSLFLSVLLNTKFKGHKIVKTIFFIPVIYNVTIVNQVLNGAFGSMASEIDETGFTLATKFTEFLMQIGIGEGLVEFLTSAVARIFSIINMSGIQILIFLAALQSVPKHLYEAAVMEGATKYEMFWKITIPMVSPMILTCIVYTIVDRFGSTELMQAMCVNSQGTTLSTNEPGMFAAISIVYFLANGCLILIAFLLMRKAVFYYDK